MHRRFTLFACIAALCAPGATVTAHESFLLWHDHQHATGADHSSHSHSDHGDHKGHLHEEKEILAHEHSDHRWAIGTGVRYTRLSLYGERADLWETGLGIAYRVLPWLEVGAEASYGWFDSREGDTSGWMVPHLHADAHIPIAQNLEFVVGGEVGFPGDEALVGEHWEFVPHIALRYDTGKWFAEAGASYVFITGGDHDHSHHDEEIHDEHSEEEAGHEHEHEHEAEEDHGSHAVHEEEHGSSDDFHEIIDPHAERELQYHAALGVRLLDQRLTLEGRVSGVRVTQGETDDRNYLRAGLRTTWALSENWKLRAEASVPITDARRNHFQGSLSVQVGF